MKEFDLTAFAREPAGQLATGRVPLQAMPRMIAESVAGAPDEGDFVWTLTVPPRDETAPWTVEMPEIAHFVRLRVSGAVWLPCQRCLEPYRQPIDTDTLFAVADDEAQADAVPVLDEGPEVLVGSALFDLGELIEEELLLGLPSAPKHAFGDAACVVPAGLVQAADEGKPEAGGKADGQGSEKPHPFAALAAWKDRNKAD